MKKVIATIIIASTLLVTANIVRADDKYKFDPDRRIDHMSEVLNLSEEQQREIKKIMVNDHQTMQQLRELRQQKINSVLTPEQQLIREQMSESKGFKKKGCDKR